MYNGEIKNWLKQGFWDIRGLEPVQFTKHQRLALINIMRCGEEEMMDIYRKHVEMYKLDNDGRNQTLSCFDDLG